MKTARAFRPAALLLAGGGAIAGAGITLLAVAAALASQQPERDLFGIYGELVRGAVADPLAPGPALVGAIVGFLFFGALGGNPIATGFLRGLVIGIKLFVGIALGAGVGLLTYLLLWLATNQEQPIGDALARLPFAATSPRDPLGAFLVAGAIAGLAVALSVVAASAVRGVVRAGTGGVVGALAGLVTFAVGYVTVNYPRVEASSDYMFHFAEAVYSFSGVEFLFIALGTAVGLLTANYSWRLYGILTLVSLVCIVLGYIAYTLSVTLPNVRPESKWWSNAVFVVEAMSLSMVLLYSFYSIDVTTRKHWRRTPADSPFSSYYMPRVCIQVPTYNEPPEIVHGTLQSLLNLDYPVDRFMIMVLDDSTDPAMREPLRAFCEGYRGDCRLVYLHRGSRQGYKAGALNYGLERTPDDVNLVAIVDADYQVAPEYLRQTVGYFIDPDLGWLQTPQDYRNADRSFLTRQYYLQDAYFYRAVLPSRNEENSIIFCGTMGILRKQALVSVGGWGEKYITEDAELSLRLVNAGWKSLYVNRTYGRGLIPDTFEAYRKQQYRWAFGGGKILRGHFFDFLFGRFTPRQRFDFFVGTINWLEGGLILLISLAVLAMSWAEIAGLGISTHHSNEILLIGLVPWFLLVDGLSRVHFVLRQTMRMSFGASLRILGMWMSVKFSNAFAASKAVLGFNIPFIRTRKTEPERVHGWRGIRQAVALTRFESTMFVVLLATLSAMGARTFMESEAAGGPVLARTMLMLWLLFYAFVFFTAPLYAYRSYSTLTATEKPAPVPAGVGRVTPT